MTWLRPCPLLATPLLLAALTGLAIAQQFPIAPAENPLREPSPSATEEAPSATDTMQSSSAGDEKDEQGEPPETRETFDEQAIDKRLADVDQMELSDDEKKTAKTLYQQARQSTAELQKWRSKVAEFAKEYTVANDGDNTSKVAGRSKAWYATQLKKSDAELRAILFDPFEIEQADLAALEEKSTRWEDRVNFWSGHSKEIEARPAARSQFLSNFQTQRQKIEQQLQEVISELTEITEINSEVTNARRIALTQQAASLEARIQALEEERKKILLGQEVHEMELKLARRKLELYSKALDAVRNEIAARRKRAAHEQSQTAQREADRNKALIQRNEDSLGELAAYNQALTQELKELVSQQQRVEEETLARNARNAELTGQFESFKAKFEDGETLSQTGGQMLREQRSNLPRTLELTSELQRRTQKKNQMSLLSFDAALKRSQLEDEDAAAQKVLQKVQAEDRAAAEKVIREMQSSQREFLDSYVENLDRLAVELSKLIVATEQLKNTTAQFREFIAQRDLWIRSCQPLWTAPVGLTESSSGWRPFYLTPAFIAVTWSLDPANWLQAASDLQAAAYRRPLNTSVIAIAFVLLLYAQRQARRQIKQLGEQAAKKNCTEFFPSLRTVWLTVIVALPWPLLIWGVGWLLESSVVESEFTLALSQSTRTVAWILLLTEFFRQVCRSEGLAEAHLGWPHAALMQLRRYLRWVPVFVAPLVFWFVGLDVQSTEPLWSASLGRVLFLIVMGYAALALWRLLMSHSSAIHQQLSRGTENWLLNLHRVWRPALVVLPIALGVMATLGYYYTAEQLANRVLATAAMLLVLMIAGGMLRRWVLLNRRQLAREQAKQRRAQAQSTAVEGEEVSSLAEYVEEAVDLTALSEATRKLLRVLLLVTGVIGAIIIWQDVFPALAWLDENALPWSTGDSPTTWGNLLRSLLALGVTYVAVRDLPSLLELVVLQHLPIDSGARYAISTLARYLLLAIGIVVAAAALGITGTSISWLVAAMGVGLGFGLQEIFANFVSGIILLFERPIRVGDIITLGEKTGVVSRIRMRATTITDWDRKEYVVPNKDLVTERLLNWTLSDQTNRIVIEVGVAYGSDTDQACKLLRQVVEEHPETLDDPAAMITFESFGDSTLNLTVRCYLPNLEKRLLTIHELHTAINQRFNEAGIEIAFPQRDLHIRSMPSGWEHRPTGDSASSNGQHEGASQADSK